MRSYLIVITCVVIGVLGLQTIDAEAATIGGRVTAAESDDPLTYVNILLSGETPQGGKIRAGKASDPNGRFRFTDLPGGTYTLRFLYIGYQEHEEKVIVDYDDDVELVVRLKVEPIEVEEIVVEADRFKNERDIQPGFVTLDAETIKDVPGIVESDPLRSIQLLPGVQAASDISSGLYIRGGGPDQTLVLLDDVPVYNPTHALGFFSTFNADAVGDITLYKGAYPAKHGGRLGAVLDVNSREPTTPKITGTGGASTIAARVTLEGPLKNNHWMVSARRTYLEPFLAAIRSKENPIPSYYFYDLNAKFTTERDKDWWVLNGYRGRDVIGFDLDVDGEVDVGWGNTVLSAAYNRMLGESLLGKIQLSGSEYESLTEASIFGTYFEITNRLRDLTLLGDLDWYGAETNRIRGGLQWSLYEFTYDQEFNKEEPVIFGTTPYEVSAYIDDQWKPRTGTALRFGLRSRYLDDGERFLLEPRFSASQAITGDVRLKLGAGLYNQYVQLVATEAFSFGDFYVPIDETAEPGQSWQVVLGTEWIPDARYRFTVEAYYTGLDKLVQLDNSVPADQESLKAIDIFNTGGTGYATGLEFFAERRMGALTGWIGYTLGWTRRTFDEINGGEEFPPKYDRRHDLNCVASYERGDWTFGAALVFASGQAFTPASAQYGLRDPTTGIYPEGGRVLPAKKNSARLLPYHRLDVSVAKKFDFFDRDAEAFVQVFNLYSRRNEWFVQFWEEDGEVDVTVVKM
ncbi:MAG: TonB-dependent receptor, partial [Candidatus Latescibacterota bacterium]